MNVISYINGDIEITDYPECSARPLALLVQLCNDILPDQDGFLSPEDSLIVLDLGCQTVGTAGVADSVIHSWIAGLLDNPEWGVIRYNLPGGIAEMHRKVARGEIDFHVWSADAYPAAKYTSVFTAATAAWFTAESVSYSVAKSTDRSADYIKFVQYAISSWRELAGLDTAPEVESYDINQALSRISGTTKGISTL